MVAICSHRGTQAEAAQSIELLHQLIGNSFITRYYNGDAWIDRLRSVAATEFLKHDVWGDYMIFIDDDIVFLPEHVIAIYDDLREGHDLIGGLYPTRSGSQLASYGLGDFGGIQIDGSIQEICWLATGFMGFSRKLLQDIVDNYEGKGLPLLHEGQWCENYPFFVFHTHKTEAGNPMLISEDWDFCEKAKSLGYKVYADTKCMLGHKGDRVYSLSDVISHNRRQQVHAERLKGILDIDLANVALQKAIEVLDDFGAKAWIDSGTLLSAIRDKDLNKYDHDIDVRVFKDDIPDEVMPELIASLYSVGYMTVQQNAGERKQLLCLYENELMLDLKFVESNDKWVWHYVWDKTPGSSIVGDKAEVVAHVFPKKFFRSFDTVELRGNKYLAPRPVLDYLTYHYGEQWKEFKAKPEDVDMTDFQWDAQHTPPCSKSVDELEKLIAPKEKVKGSRKR